MNPILKNLIALVTGWVIGSVINMLLVQTGHAVFPLEGIDPNDIDALTKAMPEMDFNFFIFPFLAHAMGTLSGAFVTSMIAASHKMALALAIGVLFLAGGIAINIMLPGPTWFAVADLLFAYIPMAWLGHWISIKIKPSRVTNEN